MAAEVVLLPGWPALPARLSGAALALAAFAVLLAQASDGRSPLVLGDLVMGASAPLVLSLGVFLLAAAALLLASRLAAREPSRAPLATPA